ncbi:transposase [Aphelenchoides avenae]|nr:transposase [Aphelenchus avenae]
MSEEGSPPLFVDDDAASDKENAQDAASAETDGSASKKSSRGRRSTHGIEYPDDGVCPFCKKKTSKPNWARHLSLVHADEVKKAEDAQSTQRSSQQQQQLQFPVIRSVGRASRLLALYAGSSTTPLQHVESNRFLKGLLEMVPKFKVPDRRTLGQQVDTELSHLQETIAKYLGGSKYYYSFGVDISTTKGMMLSLIGITAHVFAENGSCVRAFGLELVEMEERHTAVYVRRLFNATLEKLKLREARTLRIVTDCGKNMINAFYEPYRVVDDEADPDEGEIDFVERDEDEMDQIAAGFEPEEPETWLLLLTAFTTTILSAESTVSRER